MATTARSSFKPLASAAACSTPSASSASMAPTLSNEIWSERSSAATRSTSRAFHRDRGSSGLTGWSSADRTSRAVGSVTQVRVRKGLAAITVTTVRSNRPDASRRSIASGAAPANRASPSSAPAGSAELPTASATASRCVGTGLRSGLMTWLRVALCQLDLVVGDLGGNVEKIVGALGRSEDAGADLAVFPELAITGYPPEDLLLKPGFVADNQVALTKVAQATERCVAIVGFVDERIDLYDAAAVCAGGEVVGVYHKCNLPNYSVFDEQRYFVPGRGAANLYLIGEAPISASRFVRTPGTQPARSAPRPRPGLSS